MDNLKTPAHKFYNGMKLFEKHDKTMDIGGRAIILEACKRKHIQEAKKYGFMRRVSSEHYITRDKERRQMYLSSFDQLGARWVKDADEVNTRQEYNGWYTDGFQDATLIGVVLCFTRHDGHQDDGQYQGVHPNKPKGRVIYMAGTRHSDWDGVTLDLDTTDDPITAARWADSMAEREAESCREEDEKYQAEQRVEELLEQIKAIRTRCLKLLRDMRPIRKGMHGIPESICDTLRTAVQGYVEEIATLRGELEELQP
jgi:hypothetical protein